MTILGPRVFRAFLPLALASAVASGVGAQTLEGSFGVQVARGPSDAAQSAAPTAQGSDVWIDPVGFGAPVLISRGTASPSGSEAEEQSTSIPMVAGLPCASCRPQRRLNTVGVVLLPRYPAHRVWWDWIALFLHGSCP